MKFDGILGLGRMKEAVVANASFIHNLKYDVSKFFNMKEWLPKLFFVSFARGGFLDNGILKRACVGWNIFSFDRSS